MTYLNFKSSHKGDPLYPTYYDILSFVIFLRDRLKAPGSVLNYLSGVRTWVAATSGVTAPFESYQVSILKKGIANVMNHTPSQATPISPALLMNIVNSLCVQGNSTLVVRAVFLMAFFTLLRQSNLLVAD